MSDSEYYSEDEGDQGILKKALDVSLPDDFDPTKIPETGEEYLQHVMYERKQCQTWLVADIDRSKFKHKQTLKITVDKTDTKTPKTLLPSLKWQEEKLQEFLIFRKFLQFKVTTEPAVTSFDEEKFPERLLKETPLFSEIITYSQAAKIRMLQLIAKHLENIETGSSFPQEIGTWIYALLSLIEKPLNPSFCYTLREFVKKLIAIRSHLPEACDKSIVVPLNLFICIIARFFQQLDLADV